MNTDGDPGGGDHRGETLPAVGSGMHGDGRQRLARPTCDWWIAFTPAAPMILAWFFFLPLSRYPANDDFLYYRNVHYWSVEKQWVFCTLDGKPTVTCPVHCALGWLATNAFGFSFVAVQFSAFLICIFGVAAAYDLARTLGASRQVAWMFGGTLACSPFYFGHAFSFMTDGPAAAWMTLAMALYARGIVGSSHHDAANGELETGAASAESPALPAINAIGLRWLAFGSIASAAGVWTRQSNAVSLAAPLTAIFCVAGLRQRWRPFFAALAIPLMALTLGSAGIFDTGTPDQAYPGLFTGFSWAWLKNLAIAVYGGMALCGLFTLPIAWAANKSLPKLAVKSSFVLSLMALAAGLPLFFTGGNACITNATGYFLQNAHFGPILLSDAFDDGRWGDIGDVRWPVWFWTFLTVLSIVAAIIAGFQALIDLEGRVRRWRAWKGLPPVAAFSFGSAVGFACAAVLLVFVVETRFDRYWMTTFALLLGLMATVIPKTVPATSMVWACLAYAILTAMSVIFTHDYLAWNQARWTLYARAASVRAGSSNGLWVIDGGYEINGWFRAGEDPETTIPSDRPAGRFWATPGSPGLAVAPRQVADKSKTYRVLDRQFWRSWARWGSNREIVLGEFVPEPDKPAERFFPN